MTELRTLVEDIATEPGIVRFVVRRLTLADGAVVGVSNHRAALDVSIGAEAAVAEVDARADGWPALDASQIAAIEQAFAECQPRPAVTPTLEEARADKLERLASARRNASRDFAFNGAPMELTTQTEDAIAKALLSLQRQPPGTTVQWEVTRGVFMTLDVDAIGAIGDAAFIHVQACFANAKAKADALHAAQTIEELDAVDLTTGWPGQ